jgi:ParB-like chromosome segregation protein Spo0J
MLDEGHAGSIDELARRYNVDRSYVGRMLKLTSLAPGIVEAILAGSESGGLSLGTLREGVPLWWEQPRQRWLN